MTTVVDASVVVAALVSTDADGAWAESLAAARTLVAPSLLPSEVANVLRRLELAGEVDATTSSLAFDDLQALDIALYEFEAVADRCWELRSNLTAYDASYVALAELLGAPLATLDRRLVAAPGASCRFETPPG